MFDIRQHSSRSTWVTTLICFSAVLAMAFVEIGNAGISGLGIARGRITLFGSVVVNDREFDIAGAAITINGQAAIESDLRLGQIVIIRGLADDEIPIGFADEIAIESTVQGSISSIDADDERLTVLGQAIFVDRDTLFERQNGGNEFDDFAVGDVVEVNGFAASDGELLASRIEQKPPGSENRVTGVVNNLAGMSFDINALTVDFTNAVLVDFPAGMIEDGDNVRVRGSTIGPGGKLIASKVEFLPAIEGATEGIGEVEGLIDDFNSATNFSVGGIPVTTNQNTGFVGGGPANLAADSNVVVRGEFDASESLVATEVTIRGTRIRVHGTVTASAAPALTVLGVPLLATPATRVRDKSDADVEPFSVADIAIGDYVEARSEHDPAAVTPIIAARIRREDPESSVRLQGFVGAIGTQSFDMFGATIHVTNNTEFEDANDEEISSQKFFNAITPGVFVKVRGDEWSGTNVTASDIELQIDD